METIGNIIYHYAIVKYPYYGWRVSFNDLTKKWEIGCIYDTDDHEYLNTYDKTFFCDGQADWYQIADAIGYAIYETAIDAKEDYEQRHKNK